MIDITLIQVAILWSILGLSMICAINARGLFRQLVSWAIVIGIAGAAAFFSYLGFENVKQDIGLSTPLAASSNSEASSSSSSEVENIENDSIIESYIATEKQLLENIATVSDSILAFPNWKNIYSQGIEKRENYESKARFLRNRSADSFRQVRNLRPPDEKSQSYDLLVAAADNLRLAGYEIHHQFGLEADTLGENFDKARKHASQAKSIISTITGKE
ncbi:MAG: hypothetical protein LBQ76_04930 [Candidatus Fibromonas sp.]|jgi:hypothetical protein|nr:hypothetical protein [Candidatus Fibromonas sp.]